VAKRWVELKPGRDHLIRLTPGVMVSGRIEKDGLPLKVVVVGLMTKERAAGEHLRRDELATDKNGLFLFPNVPPDREFVLWAKMESMRGCGARPAKMFKSDKDAAEVNWGRLEVKPACAVSGRLVLSDGKPMPPKTRLFLGREQAWDPTAAEIGEDGRFEFKDMPAESVSLSVRVKGYKFSKRNPSPNWLNGGIVGHVTGDIRDLKLLLAPGTWRYNGEEGEPPEGESQPWDEPFARGRTLMLGSVSDRILLGGTGGSPALRGFQTCSEDWSRRTSAWQDLPLRL
jgi:hypothetical protein